MVVILLESRIVIVSKVTIVVLYNINDSMAYTLNFKIVQFLAPFLKLFGHINTLLRLD